jgi:magnesium transporter
MAADRRHLPRPVSLIRRRPRSTSPALDPEPAGAAPMRSGLVDSAVYRDGKRQASTTTLGETFRVLREQDGGIAWIGLYRPDVGELNSLAEEFDLHPLAVEDAITAHQRPKLERYGPTLFVVLRAARYLDDVE